MVCGARFEHFAEARVEVVLFLVAEDAARESWEVVGSVEEAGYSGGCGRCLCRCSGGMGRGGFSF